MGCDEACKKKKAEKKKKKSGGIDPPKAPKFPNIAGIITPVVGKGTVLLTVGDVLGKAEQIKAMLPWEVMKSLEEAAKNPKIIANKLVSKLIPPIKAAFGIYSGLIIAQKIYNIVKPVVKLAVNINGIIVLNFANLGEMLADIAVQLMSIFVGMAPVFLSLLKNIFFQIPLVLGSLEKSELNQINNLITTAKDNLKQKFQKAVIDLKAKDAISDILPINSIDDFDEAFDQGMKNCKSIILKSLADVVDTETISLNSIPEIGAYSIEDKNIARQVIDGLLNAAKKIEILQAGQIIDKNFYDQNSDDTSLKDAAVQKMKDLVNNKGYTLDDAFAKIFAEEVEKKKSITEQIREDISAINFAEQIILNNKAEFINSMINKVSSLGGIETPTLYDTGKTQAPIIITSGDGSKITGIIDGNSFSGSKGTGTGTGDQGTDTREIIIGTIRIENGNAIIINKKDGKTYKGVIDGLDTDGDGIADTAYVSLSDSTDITSSIDDKNIRSNAPIIKVMYDDLKNVLDTCYQKAIINEFITLQSTLITSQTSIINGTSLTDQTSVDNLITTVLGNIETAVNNLTIVVTEPCASNFNNSICTMITAFKNKLYALIKEAIDAGDISLKNIEIPDYIDKYELKKMMKLMLAEVKKILNEQNKEIIIEEVVPCKSCRPCEDMIADINIYISKRILLVKDNIKNKCTNQVNNSGQDWTWNNNESELKTLLIEQITKSLNNPVKEIDILSKILFKLQAEQKELLKTVSEALTQL